VPVEFRLLGEVEVRVGGRPVDIGHARQRCVLVVLLAGDGDNLTAEQILDRAWSSPPGGGRDTLYSYLSRLRRLLAPIGGVDLVRRRGGYALQVDPMSVDLHRFHHWLAEAGRAPDDTGARRLLEQALRLWGDQDAFAHLDTPWLNTFREGLARERYAAELDLADLKLRAGLHAELVPLLSRRAAQYPLDERLRGQLMLALYRSGRTAHALEHYQQLRSHLAEELGVDPGPGLTALHQQVLAADPALAPAPAETAAVSRTSGGSRIAPLESTSARQPGVTPRQLPAPPPRFTGRTGELAVLGAVLEEATATGETVGIAAISGGGGIGKTWLALHWAYRNLDRFPEGQLFVNMRGFDPVEQPTSPYIALRGFLDALGVPSSAVPADQEAQVALYRSVVAGRRLLIVLDNVRDAVQAEPLLPGSPSCTVLVTSRHRLTGLVTAHGARPVPVDVLGEAEAHQLLDRHLGPARTAAEPQAVADLLAHCSGLPLALGILTARAVLDPQLRLADLADEVRHSADGLDVLDTGELRTSLRAVFASSHRALSARAAEVFALLGLAPGPDTTRVPRCASWKPCH
jgi:DNA-binding SARP family transcriptional activator